MGPETILVIVEIAGGLLVVGGVIWGVIMRPLTQRMADAEDSLVDHEKRLRDTEALSVAHGVHIETLTTSINNLVVKLDVFMQQLMHSNKD